MSYIVSHRVGDHCVQPDYIVQGSEALQELWIRAENMWGLIRQILVRPQNWPSK